MKKDAAWTEENYKLLQKFFKNSHDGIFITDGNGKILLANPTSVEFSLGNHKELIGNLASDLVDSGVYEQSTTMVAIQKRKTITGIVKAKSGLEMISTSKPLFNEDGDVELVITNSRPLKTLKEILDSHDKSILKKDVIGKSIVEQRLLYGSNVMKELMKKVDVLARTNGTVMISGQTGSGKGLMAEYIHEKSHRNEGPFIELNCAAIPENLIESELFGYERGAFTGANPTGKTGLFEVANGGTLFLDEIGEMPLALQAKLLKVLDAGYILPVGGTVYRKVNVRLVVATNRDLKQLVRDGKFREDLYYRLNVFPINIPALKDRKEDLGLLLENELVQLNKKYNDRKVFSEETKRKICSYDWPGNIRQMKNVLERVYVFNEGKEIQVTDKDLVDDVHDLFFEEDNISTSLHNSLLDEDMTLKDYVKSAEKQYVLSVIKQCKGNINEAATKLGVHRTTLYKKLDDWDETEN